MGCNKSKAVKEPSLDEQKKKEEEKARRKAEEEKRKAEEARRKAEEEERLKAEAQKEPEEPPQDLRQPQLPTELQLVVDDVPITCRCEMLSDNTSPKAKMHSLPVIAV